MPDRPIARAHFIDGSTRTAFLAPDGRQYVLDATGEPVYGTWIYPDADDKDEVAHPDASAEAPASKGPPCGTCQPYRHRGPQENINEDCHLDERTRL